MSSCSVNQPRQNTKSQFSSRQNSKEPLTEEQLCEKATRFGVYVEGQGLDNNNSSQAEVPNTMS